MERLLAEIAPSITDRFVRLTDRLLGDIADTDE